MIHPEPPNSENAHRSPSDCCIFRVQKHLREVNKEAYEPNIIAIGPYHHNKGQKYLMLMEDHKERYLQNLLIRKNHDRQMYIDRIEDVFEEVQKCYAEPLENYGLDQLVLDGCFIVELVRKSSNVVPREENDPIFRMDWITNSLKRDLLLFENQIPFFIICILFNITKDEDSNETFTRLARDFFRDILPGVAREDKDDTDDPKKFKHLLGLIHSSWLPLFTKSEQKIGWFKRFLICIRLKKLPISVKKLPISVKKLPISDKSNEEQNMGWFKRFLICIRLKKLPISDDTDEDKKFAIRLENFKYIHCVTDLTEVGIKFKKGKGNIFNIRFENGSIIIPPFIVESRTESFFRNLIAHEQYRQGTDRHFVTDYVKVMDCFINSSRDVGVLRRRMIINNWLGDDEVVTAMFNKMTDSVVASGEFFHYKDVFNEIDAYYHERRHRWMAVLRRNYLSSPWGYVSIAAAFILLVLTLLQTIFTIKG